MDAESRGRSAIRVKAEDDSGDVRMADDKPTYRSWKKKYRKMRIIFDQKMHEGEELHKLEQKALATAKRLAIQKEYVCHQPLADSCFSFSRREDSPADTSLPVGYWISS